MSLLAKVSAWPARKKLILLVLLVLLPASGLLVASNVTQRGEQIQAAEQRLQELVESLAAQQEQIAYGTKMMLSTLAQLPEVQSLDAAASHELFRNLISQYPLYSTIGLATPEGKLLAGGVPYPPASIDVSEQKHIKDVVRTLDFSVGEYIVGKVSKTASINYAYPVLDADKNLKAILIAGFDLRSYASFIAKADLPTDFAVVVADHKGVRLYRVPENDATAVGKKVADSAFKAISGEREQGIVERVADDGILRVYAFKQLRLDEKASPYLYLIAGIPKDKITHRADVELMWDLSMLAVFSLLLAGLAVLLADYTFARPLNRLVLAAQRFALGETGVRTDLPHTGDEVGRLAQSFDQMVSMLEERDSERRQMEEKLRRSEERYRTIVTKSSDGIFENNDKGVLTFVNEALARIHGYDRPEEIEGKSILEFIAPSDREKVMGTLALAVSTGKVPNALEQRNLRRDGQLIEVEVRPSMVRREDGAFTLVGVLRDVSETKRMERLLRESEEKYRRIFENAIEGIFQSTPEGNYLTVNPAFAGMFGFDSPEQMIQEVHNMGEQLYVHLEDRLRIAEQLNTEGTIRGFQIEVCKRNGERFWISFNARCIRDPNGDIRRYNGFATDITERKHLEDALRKSEERVSLALQGGDLGLWDWNIETGEVVFNERWAEMLGYTPEEIEPHVRSWEKLVHPEDLPAVMEVLNAHLEGRTPYYESEHRLLAKSGDWVWVLDKGKVTDRDEQGRPLRVVGTHLDLSERKVLEIEREQYFSLFNTSTDLMTILDLRSGCINRVNPSGAKILGYTAQELAGRPYMDLVHPDDRQKTLDGIKSHLERGWTTDFENRYLRKDGSAGWLSWQATQDVVTGLTYATARDITDRKRAEALEKEVERQRQQILKAESLNRMAGAIAHHFNNMLGAVMGNLELASDDVPQDTTLQHYLTEAMNASRRAADISRSMLVYLGQTTSKRELVDIVETTSEVLPFVSTILPKKVRFESDLPLEAVKVLANVEDFRQVLTNLVVNAYEAIGENEGFITVAIHPVEASDILASGVFPPEWKPMAKRYACLSVSDTGCGMDEATQNRLFDPFFSTKFTGRGLGLAMVLGLVRAHEGAIVLESREGWGSTFRVYFPIPELAARLSAKEPLASSEGIESQRLVLLVEDEPMVRKMAETMLKRMGLDVISACDGVEAVEIFREQKDEIGFVLLDLSMPRMGGWETLSTLRALRPDTPVILASGYDEGQVMGGDHSELPQAFLQKPYRKQDLKAAIGKAMGPETKE